MFENYYNHTQANCWNLPEYDFPLFWYLIHESLWSYLSPQASSDKCVLRPGTCSKITVIIVRGKFCNLAECAVRKHPPAQQNIAAALTATIQFELTYPTPKVYWTLITASTTPTTSTTTSAITSTAATNSVSSMLLGERPDQGAEITFYNLRSRVCKSCSREQISSANPFLNSTRKRNIL